MPLNELLDRNASYRPDHVALVFDRERISWLFGKALCSELRSDYLEEVHD